MNVEEDNENYSKKGIIYLSRIPLNMKVSMIRNIFSSFGEVDRIFLNPESDESRHFRIKAGGNKKRRFIDGWVEFLDKKVAKRVSLTLNNTPVGLIYLFL
jgi:ESF2/ABP1 family protein